MGNTLSPMQASLAERGDSSARDAKETLDRLEEMARDRIDLFYDKIGHDDLDRNLIPIKRVLNKNTYIGVTVKECDIWMEELATAVHEFSFGPIAEGLCSVATTTIIRMIGASQGTRQTTQRYAISIDWLGGISRLDYYFFVYTFSSSELARKETSLVAACVVESSANIENLDFNTLRVIIARAFRGGDVNQATVKAIYTQLITMMHQPKGGLSLTAEDKAVLANWYKCKPANQKMVTNKASNHESQEDVQVEGDAY